MTFEPYRKSSRMRGDANPALTAALAITAIAAATLAGAWFFQLVLDIQPCPLCLEQRYAYYLAVPLGALVALAGGEGRAARACCWRALRCSRSRRSPMPGSAAITPASNGDSGRGRPNAPGRWSISAAPAACSTARQGQGGPLRRGAVALPRAVARRLQRADLAVDGRDRRGSASRGAVANMIRFSDKIVLD